MIRLAYIGVYRLWHCQVDTRKIRQGDASGNPKGTSAAHRAQSLDVEQS